MKKLLVQLPYPPTVNHYYRRSQRGVFITKKGRWYREEVCAIIRDLHVRQFAGELQLTIRANPPDNRRRDADNILKSLLDALQHAGVYADDSQIKKLSIEMLEPHRPHGKVEIRITKKRI